MERSSIEMPVGPLWTRGDAHKAPEGASSKIRNATLRRGQIEKRPGWLREATLATSRTPGRLLQAIYPNHELMIYGGTTTDGGAYRDSSAVWQQFTSNNGITIQDGDSHLDEFYFTSDGSGSTKDGSIAKIDSSGTITDNVTLTRLSAKSLESFNTRLFAGGVSLKHTTGGAFKFDFDNGAEWTISGSGSPTVSTEPSVFTIKHATDNAINSAAGIYTTGASPEYVTVVWSMQPVEADSSVPIKLLLVDDSSGTNTFGSWEFPVPSASVDSDYVQYSGTVLVPASTDVYVRLEFGNSTSDATVDTQVRIGNSSDNKGVGVYPGHFVYPFGEISGSITVGDATTYLDRLYWSEAIDVTDWRNENFAVCNDTPGAITAVRKTKNKIVAYKAESMYIFRYTDSATQPIIRENLLDGIGCNNVRAIDTLDDVHFFVGRDEVYVYDGAAYPKPIAGEGMKDELFDATNLVATPIIEVHRDAREVWVHTQAYKIHIYSLDTNQWVGYYQLTDSSGSETPHGDILDLVYMQPQNESKREMWILFTNDSAVNTIAKLRDSQTQDDLDGTDRDIVAEYAFSVLQGGRPRRQITVQVVGIDHRVSASQAGSTTSYQVSLDGGSTFGKHNTVVLGPVTSTADTDTDIMRVSVHQTAPRLVLKMVHTGLGGPAYFNMTGGQADIIVRGKEIQATNPTQSSSSL